MSLSGRASSFIKETVPLYRAHLRWFLTVQLPVYREEFVTPLKMIAEATRALYRKPTLVVDGAKVVLSYVDAAVKSDAARNMWHGVKQVASLPAAIRAIHQSHDTREVIKQTAVSNLVYSVVPVVTLYGAIRPALQYYLPYSVTSFGQTIHLTDPLIWYMSFLSMRESVRRLFVYAPVYNICLPQALNKDLEWSLALDLVSIFKNTRASGPEGFFLRMMKPADLKWALNEFEKEIYKMLSHDLARIAIKILSNPKIVTKAFSEQDYVSISSVPVKVEAKAKPVETIKTEEKGYVSVPSEKVKPLESHVEFKDEAADVDGYFSQKMIAEFKGYFHDPELKTKISHRAKMCVNHFEEKLKAKFPYGEKGSEKVAAANEALISKLKMTFDSIQDMLEASLSEVKPQSVAEELLLLVRHGKSRAKHFLPLLPSKHFNAQTCTLDEKMQTVIKNPVIYLLSVRAQHFPCKLLPSGNLLTEAFLTGYLLLDYKMGAVGMGLRQRFQIVAKNLGYCLMLGATIMGLSSLAAAALAYLPGTDNALARALIPHAVYPTLFQLFTTVSLLQTEELPATKMGLDVFRPIRCEASNAIKEVSGFVRETYHNEEFKRELMQFTQRPFVKGVRALFAGGKLKTSDAIVRVPAINLFFELFGDDVLSSLKYIEDVRNARVSLRVAIAVTAVVSVLVNFFPTQITAGTVQKVTEILKLLENNHVGLAIVKFKELAMLAERYRKGYAPTVRMTDADYYDIIAIVNNIPRTFDAALPDKKQTAEMEKKESKIMKEDGLASAGATGSVDVRPDPSVSTQRAGGEPSSQAISEMSLTFATRGVIEEPEDAPVTKETGDDGFDEVVFPLRRRQLSPHIAHNQFRPAPVPVSSGSSRSLVLAQPPAARLLFHPSD